MEIARPRQNRLIGCEWHFQNPAVRSPSSEIPAGKILLSLKRRIAGALHDDLRVCSYFGQPAQVRLVLQLDADFADIFQVKQQNLPPRLNVLRIAGLNTLTLLYDRAGFRRGLRVRFDPSGGKAFHIGTQTIFELDLLPNSEWTCCIEACPMIDGQVIGFAGDPHASKEQLTHAKPAAGLLIRTGAILQAPLSAAALICGH